MNTTKSRTNIPEFMRKPLREIPYVILDLETTGFKPESAGVTEVAIIVLRNGREEYFEQLMDPGMAIPPKITSLTGITDEMVRGKPRFGEVLLMINEMFKDAVFVSHNVPFDWSFFAYNNRKYHKIDMKMPSLCTLRLARKMLTLQSNTLENVAKHFQIKLVDAHRAMNDTRAVKGVLEAFLDLFETKGILTGEDLYKHNLIFPEKPPTR